MEQKFLQVRRIYHSLKLVSHQSALLLADKIGAIED